jgi:hypothetical protein
LLRIMSRKDKANAKVAKALSNACGCSLTPDGVTSFGGCFKDCLKDAGVSPVSLAACGAVCASENLIGCAICVGVQEWVALACGQYCAWRKVFYDTKAYPRPTRPRDMHMASQLSPASS